MSDTSSSVSLRTIPVGGLNVDVYGLDEVTASPGLAVSVLFALHGRLSDKAAMDGFCRAAWAESHAAGAERKLLVINLEQRNHGTREVAPHQNRGFKTRDDVAGNPSHFVDMYAIYTGSAQDVSFLIDLLPAVLFPQGEHEVAQWLAAGVSLGGHAVWTLLATEPRISVGVPIIGCPDYLSLMRERMAKIPIAFGPPAVPSSMISLIAARAPPSTAFTSADPNANHFIGKKVLVLSGRRDRLVPHEPHTRAFLEKLELGPDGLKEHEEYECGHELTPEMVARAAAFITRHGLGGEQRAAL